MPLKEPQQQPNFNIRAMSFYDNDEVLDLCRYSDIVLGDQVNLTMMKIDHNCLHVAEDIENGKYACGNEQVLSKILFVCRQNSGRVQWIQHQLALCHLW